MTSTAQVINWAGVNWMRSVMMEKNHPHVCYRRAGKSRKHGTQYSNHQTKNSKYNQKYVHEPYLQYYVSNRLPFHFVQRNSPVFNL